MKCFEVTGCSEELRKSCFVWTSFQADSPEMENAKCWVIKGVYHPDQKIQLAKCRKCKYFSLINKETGITQDVMDDVAVITCNGSLNNDRVKALDYIWESVNRSGKEHVILDISRVTNIYSCGIGLIVKMHKEIEAHNGLLVVTGAQDFPFTLLKSVHLDTMLHLAEDRTAALAIFEARIQKLLEEQRLEEEAERARNAPRKRMPCWEYWDDHNPANSTGCNECFRKITENTEPCWIMNGYIEGVSFQYVCEDCIGCSYYEEFKNTVKIAGISDIKEDREMEKVSSVLIKK